MVRSRKLNGYPGPRHVQDLAQELNLTPAQISATEKLFATADQGTGTRRIVSRRGAPSRSLFASREITPALLATSLDRIGTLQAKMRNTHLQAHIDEERVLSPEQNARFAQLRGYGNPGSTMHHDGSHDH